ncbi:hypothetical protein [Kitasatospora viridis]|uniref:Uncharacterized protein n=1 Tax=Kitasatospora viridis TaxID=281105 RepID=A0A561UPJ8_9ACTN|nr:hypothetical protein [Kitasatospora viridis]TWG01298.1 hypothetical protein FHX73_115190 [Kitasatospora viridis]
MEHGDSAARRRGELRGAVLCAAAVVTVDCSVLGVAWARDLGGSAAEQLTVVLVLLVGVGAGIGLMAAGYLASRARRLRCAAEGALLVHLLIPGFLAITWALYPAVAPWSGG